MKTLVNVLMLPVVIVGLCGVTDAENIVCTAHGFLGHSLKQDCAIIQSH